MAVVMLSKIKCQVNYQLRSYDAQLLVDDAVIVLSACD